LGSRKIVYSKTFGKNSVVLKVYSPCAKMPFDIWGYTGGVGGMGLMWVNPNKNIFDFSRGNFE
jgi:hypothetical protein